MSTSDSIVCKNCAERVPTDYIVCPYCGYSLIEILQEKIKTKIRFRESVARIIKLVRRPRDVEQVMKQVAANPDQMGPYLVLLLFVTAFSMKVTSEIFHMADFMAILNAYIDTRGYFVIPYQIIFLLLVYLVIPFLMAVLIVGIRMPGIRYIPSIGVIVWQLVSLVFHAVCKSLAGIGRRRDTTSIVGYSLLPLVFPQLIEAVILTFITPENPAMRNSYHEGVFIASFSGIYAVLDLIILPFMVWSFFIFYFGLIHSHRLTKNIALGVSIGFIAVLVIFGVFSPVFFAQLNH